jgi:hypothetical protein
MNSEIIQNVAYDNYDDFQHDNNFIYLHKILFYTSHIVSWAKVVEKGIWEKTHFSIAMNVHKFSSIVNNTFFRNLCPRSNKVRYYAMIHYLCRWEGPRRAGSSFRWPLGVYKKHTPGVNLNGFKISRFKRLFAHKWQQKLSLEYM